MREQEREDTRAVRESVAKIRMALSDTDANMKAAKAEAEKYKGQVDGALTAERQMRQVCAKHN